MTEINPTATDTEQEYRLIDIELIRDPQAPARETMEEKEFLELCQSIADLGLIEPIIVKDRNDHFEVVAGHRRTMACRAVGLRKLACMIRRDPNVDDLAVMIAENVFREEWKPVEEARFYLRVLDEKAEGDVDKLCSIVKRDRAHVEGRILLLSGYPNVLAALEAGHIPINVSRMLNKCKDPNRLLILLDMAVQGGANAKQVAEWVRDANGQEPIQLPPDDPEANALLAAQLAAASVRTCVICQSSEHPQIMETVDVHNICLSNFRAAQNHLHQNDPG